MLSKNCPECSDRFARSGFLPNINPISSWFWKFVRAFSARFVVRSTLRIYKNDAQSSPSRAACQPTNSCAYGLPESLAVTYRKFGRILRVSVKPLVRLHNHQNLDLFSWEVST